MVNVSMEINCSIVLYCNLLLEHHVVEKIQQLILHTKKKKVDYFLLFSLPSKARTSRVCYYVSAAENGSNWPQWWKRTVETGWKDLQVSELAYSKKRSKSTLQVRIIFLKFHYWIKNFIYQIQLYENKWLFPVWIIKLSSCFYSLVICKVKPYCMCYF